MTYADDIRSEIGTTLTGTWETQDGTKVPQPEEVQLGNHAIRLTGTVLYADLAESTMLVSGHKDWFAAEVFKCYHRSACRYKQKNGGAVTAFDGDRVMAVFVGDAPSTAAVGSALELNHVLQRILNPMVKAKYADVKTEFRHGVGIDHSPLFVARTGVRGSNDLVWVGRAANYAAKLSTIRQPPFVTWITADVYQRLQNSVKFGDGMPTGTPMWEKRSWTWQSREMEVYGSSWRRSI